MGIFKGFNIQYPRYSVLCPQTGFSYDVRSLNVAEVSKLKTSLTTPSQAPALISDVLWNAIESKPKFINNLIEFKKHTTLRDREALIYGLYQATFGDDREFSVTCRNCENVQLLKFKMSKLFSMNSYPGSETMMNSYKVAKIADPQVYDPEIEEELRKKEQIKNIPMRPEPKRDISEDEIDDLDLALGKKPGEEDQLEFVKEEEPTPPPIMNEEVEKPKEDVTSILNKKIEVTLPISKVVATIRQPTIMDEEEIISMVPFAQKKYSESLNETLVIEKFEEYVDKSKSPIQVVTEREDILIGYNSLPPQDKQKLFDEFQKHFGQYGIELKTNYICNKCDFDNSLDLDIIVQFFRMVGTS